MEGKNEGEGESEQRVKTKQRKLAGEVQLKFKSTY
jgi:hypothetical protein